MADGAWRSEIEFSVSGGSCALGGGGGVGGNKNKKTGPGARGGPRESPQT